jgi:NitT/TauT family transport system substrate-binding protein
MKAILQSESARDSAPDSYALMVPPDGSISSVEDLEGLNLGTANLGSQATINMILVLEENGMSRDDVNWVESAFPTHYDMMSTGQVDAILTINPFLTMLEMDDIAEPLLYPYLEINPLQPLGSWWAMTDWIEENEEAVERFVAAQVEASEMLVNDEDLARDHMAEFVGLDPDLLEEMLLINWNNEPSQQAWERNVEILVEGGLLTEEQSADDYWHDTVRELAVDDAGGRGGVAAALRRRAPAAPPVSTSCPSAVLTLRPEGTHL